MCPVPTAMDPTVRSVRPFYFLMCLFFMMDGKTVLENNYSVEFKQVLPADNFCKTEKNAQ